MTVPYSYQIRGARQLHKLGGRALTAWEMGTGKTFLSLLYILRHTEIRPVVIVCPPGLKWNWDKEIKLHTPFQATMLETTTPPNKKIKNKDELYIVSYNILGKRKKSGPGWGNYIKKYIKPKLIILDELHLVSNRTAIRSKSTKLLCQNVPQILGLSGTPIVNKPVELWFPLSIINPKLFPNFFDYASTFCNPKRTHWGWDFSGSSNLDQLHDILTSSCMLRLRKEDVLELPPNQRIIVPVELDDKKEYNKAVSDFINWLKAQDENKARKAIRAEKLVKFGYLKRLAAQLKIQQVFDWIDNFLKDSDGKIIVFGLHKKILHPLYNRYKAQSVLIDGSVKGADRQAAVDKFQTDSKYRICVGNIKAAGVGLTMTAASTVLFIELPWSPGDVTQAEDRAHRLGTINTVYIYYLVAKDTIEEKLCSIVTKKQSNISQVLDGEVKDIDLNLIDSLEKALLQEFSLSA